MGVTSATLRTWPLVFRLIVQVDIESIGFGPVLLLKIGKVLLIGPHPLIGTSAVDLGSVARGGVHLRQDIDLLLLGLVQILHRRLCGRAGSLLNHY